MSFASNSQTDQQVERLGVEPYQPKPRKVTSLPVSTPEGPKEAVVVQNPVSTLDVAMMAFTGLGYALSARALLLLSLIGAFVLALQAMSSQTLPALEVFIAYSLLTVAPVTILEIRKQSNHGN
jgi:hypothetical protein